MSGLVETLIEAESVAIRNQQTALKSPVGHVRGVTIELVLTSACALLGWQVRTR